jgi:hypothetical protein
MILIKHCSDLSIINHTLIKSLINLRLDQLGPEFRAILVESGDSTGSLDIQCPFPLFSNSINDTVYGEEDFVPMTEIIEDHGFCYEMVFILSDDDPGTGVFVPNSSDINPTLLALCAEFAVPAPL